MARTSLEDFLAAQLRPKSRGAAVTELAPLALLWTITQTLEGDPRFVESPGGKWELVQTRDHRHAVATGSEVIPDE